ncbi:MAG: hypothetical protein K6G55_00275 [Selenomonadaceae bacterium]|nr:hypothetical protein [Selenomonadaceae bacterium]
MDKRVKMFIGIGLVALALIIIGIGYYYFHVKNDTPDYAIEQASMAIKNHDVKEFNRVVNVDSVLDSGYDGFVAGITSAEISRSPDAREIIENFTQMLRGTMIMSLKTTVENYVKTGEIKPEENLGAVELLERTGLNGIEIRGVKDVQINDANNDEAFADVIVYQPEINREFPIQFILARNEDKNWQIVRVQNFEEYITQVGRVRRRQLDEYLVALSEINSKHEETIRNAEREFTEVMAAGNLSQDSTRADLKKLIEEVFMTDYEQRKKELFELHVPKDAETLHNLYIKICDTALSAAKDYSAWMDDKNAATIKSAEDKIHQVQTLKTEAAVLAGRMNS